MIFHKKLSLNTAMSTDEAADISTKSGQYVQVIHTDGESYENNTAIGHADYYFNSVLYNQPGCTELDACNHLESANFYLASLDPLNVFIGVQCDAIGQSASAYSRFGFYTDYIHGAFCLNTDRCYPYIDAQGLFGFNLLVATGEKKTGANPWFNPLQWFNQWSNPLSGGFNIANPFPPFIGF